MIFLSHLASFFDGVALIPLGAATVSANAIDTERFAKPFTLFLDLLGQFSSWGANQGDRAFAFFQRPLIHDVKQHRPHERRSFAGACVVDDKRK